jgi:hypothetical protein
MLSTGVLQLSEEQHGDFIERAEARLRAEREDLVRNVTDLTIKDRLAKQLGYRHDLERKALTDWSSHVERRLALLRIRYSRRRRPNPD